MSRKTKELAKIRVEHHKAKNNRKNIVRAGIALAVAIGIGYWFQTSISAPPTPDGSVTKDLTNVHLTDIIYGDEKAPVTIIEYASLACIHCANFHENALPKFVKNYVDTGKARLIFRHFPYDKAGLQAAAAVSCLPKVKQSGSVSTMMETQSKWVAADQPAQAALSQLIMSADELRAAEKCIDDETVQFSIVSPANEARKVGISGTPTFVIGNDFYRGFLSAEALGRLVDAKIVQ